jgi:hypothetical protein
MAKYCGIPGITPQSVIYEGRPGWCPKCIRALQDWYNETWPRHPTIPEVQAVYNLVFWEMLFFMRTCIVNKVEF